MDSLCSEYGVATAATGIANRRNKNENQILVRKLQRLEKEVCLASKKMLRDRQEVRFQMLKLKATNSPVMQRQSPLPTIDLSMPLLRPTVHKNDYRDDQINSVPKIVTENSLSYTYKKSPGRNRSESDGILVQKQSHCIATNNQSSVPRRRLESDTRLIQKPSNKLSYKGSPLARRRLLLSQHHNSESDLLQRLCQKPDNIHHSFNDNSSINDQKPDHIHHPFNDNNNTLNHEKVPQAEVKTKVAFTGDNLIFSSKNEFHSERLRRHRQLSKLVLPHINRNQGHLYHDEEEDEYSAMANQLGPLTKAYLSSPSPVSSARRCSSDTFKTDQSDWLDETSSDEESS
ncbi:hypothetical protein TrispH2_006476 [Trichoplax sp. H2]|nr:hypothetical protein TrispH2_006476 [Trichoplax sp. H2]|eukprot:RDD41318.1 hypothetical protein TrispH2_006476 [Trichoplax sp. H2]